MVTKSNLIPQCNSSAGAAITKELRMNTPQKSAIVTGGSSGIGLGAVKAYLDWGYGVVANSRSIDHAKLEKYGVQASPRLVLVPGDISEEVTARRIVEAALQAFGRLDVLVNSAGI